MNAVLTPPELTMPEAEAAALREALAEADAVLEYGAGGSTLLAAEAGAEVFSVESDAAWHAMMQDWFKANPPARPVHLLHVDIGPTREWGWPTDQSRMRYWPDYALKIWDRRWFRHPDLVLIDGRFRLGCFFTVAWRITRPVTVFFDDYTRGSYDKAERIARPTAMIGRMARFDLIPMELKPERMRAYTRALLQPA